MIYSVWRKTSPLCPKQHNETKPISSFPNIRFFQQQQNILWWARVRVTCKLKTNNVSTRTVRYFELVGLTNIRHTNEQVVIVTRLNPGGDFMPFNQCKKYSPTFETAPLRRFLETH